MILNYLFFSFPFRFISFYFISNVEAISSTKDRTNITQYITAGPFFFFFFITQAFLTNLTIRKFFLFATDFNQNSSFLKFTTTQFLFVNGWAEIGYQFQGTKLFILVLIQKKHSQLFWFTLNWGSFVQTTQFLSAPQHNSPLVESGISIPLGNTVEQKILLVFTSLCVLLAQNQRHWLNFLTPQSQKS